MKYNRTRLNFSTCCNSAVLASLLHLMNNPISFVYILFTIRKMTHMPLLPIDACSLHSLDEAVAAC